jgi:thiamine kinase-like enzyme
MKNSLYKFEKYKTKILNFMAKEKLVFDFGNILFETGSKATFIESLLQMFNISGYYDLLGIDGKKYDLRIHPNILFGKGASYMYSVYVVNNSDKTTRRIFILKPGCDALNEYRKILDKTGNLRYQDILKKYNDDAKYDIEKPLIPIIEKIFNYNDENNIKRCMHVLHVAPGKTYCEIFDDDELSDEIKQNAVRALGRSFSKFNFYDFDKTNITDNQNFNDVIVYTHVDCNCGNMIYNENTKRVYFIDFDGFIKETLLFQIRSMIGYINAYLDVLFDEYIKTCDESYRKNVALCIYNRTDKIRSFYREKVINVCKKYI